MDKPWHICASNAVTGEGLHEGVELLFCFYNQIWLLFKFVCFLGVEWLTSQIKDTLDNKR